LNKTSESRRIRLNCWGNLMNAGFFNATTVLLLIFQFRQRAFARPKSPRKRQQDRPSVAIARLVSRKTAPCVHAHTHGIHRACSLAIALRFAAKVLLVVAPSRIQHRQPKISASLTPF